MISRDFALVDVFAQSQLEGNPLAVVAGGDGLPDRVLQRIAGEFNQSETTFVDPPSREGGGWRLRSFTASGAEVGGAGHNALGAWWWLAATQRVEPGDHLQEIGGHVLPLAVAREGERLTVRMRQAEPAVVAEVDADAPLARSLGLDPQRLAARAAVVSSGAPHLLVQAEDRATVDAARPDAPALKARLADAGAQGCYLYALDPVSDDATAYARFFNPTVGLWEDPATGSAAGPLAWWLNRDAGDSRRAIVEQGHALGRPSRIELRVARDEIWLVGSAVLTAEGRLHVPDPEEST